MELSLQEAINRAKKNPTSPFAREMRRKIENGQVDEAALKQGVDLSPFGRPSIDQLQTGQLEQRSAEDTGALFPAETGEGPVQAGFKAVGNLPSSAVNLGKNVVGAVTNPMETLTGIGRVIRGGTQTAKEATGFAEDTGDNINEQSFDAFVRGLQERFGSLENLQRTATNDPFAFGLDLLPATQGVGRVARGTRIGRAVDRINPASGTARRTRRGVESVSQSQMEKAINLNPSDTRRIRKANIAGEDPAKWLLDRGFRGSQESIADELIEYGRATKDQLDQRLNSVPERFSGTDIQPARQALDVLEDTFQGTTGNQDILTQLENLKNADDYSLSNLNEIKRIIDRELNIYTATGDVRTGATARGLKNMRSDLQKLIENKAREAGYDDIAALNKETQVSREIAESIEKRLDVSGGNFGLGMRDYLLGGAATPISAVIGVNPLLGVAVSIAGKKFLESARFRTSFANALNKLSGNKRKVILDAAKNRSVTGEYLDTVRDVFKDALDNIELPAATLNELQEALDEI